MTGDQAGEGRPRAARIRMLKDQALARLAARFDAAADPDRMTRGPLDPAAAGALELFAAEIDDIAAKHRMTRGRILPVVIEGLEERIAEDTAILDLARRLEEADRPAAGRGTHRLSSEQ